MDKDRDYGGGLTRLADPQPDVWIEDKTQVMSTMRDGRTRYGNFWPKHLCQIRPHRWATIWVDDRTPEHPFVVNRCQRCGAQVYQHFTVAPPARGEI